MLRRFVFTIDYDHKRVDFVPTSQVNAREPYLATGLEITPQAGGTFRIVGVIEGTPAADAELKAGATLVTING